MSNQTLVILFFWGYYLCGLAFSIPKGPNVCVKTNDHGIKENYCCFNSYYYKGQCRVCRPGTFSTDGKDCDTCPPNMYGEQCKHTCDCSSTQTCNKVHGCVNLMETSSEDFDLYTELMTAFYDRKLKFKSTLASLRETTAAEAMTRENYAPDSSYDKNTSLVYYLVIAGGVVGWMVFCVAGTKFLYKWFQRKHRRAQTPNDILIPQIIIHDPVQPISDPPEDRFYDEIEEISTPGLTMKRTASYLSVIGSANSQESNLDDDKLQYEVNAVESKLTNDDTYSFSVSSVSSASSQLSVGDEYLHPYTSLESNHNLKTYEECTN